MTYSSSEAPVPQVTLYIETLPCDVLQGFSLCIFSTLESFEALFRVTSKIQVFFKAFAVYFQYPEVILSHFWPFTVRLRI